MGGRAHMQRYFLFQVYAGLQVVCLVIIGISLILNRFAVGFFEFLVITLLLVGILGYFLNQQQSKRHRVQPSFYLVSAVSCLLGILLTAQLLARFTIEGWYWQFIFFLLLIAPVAAVLYFTFSLSTKAVSRAMTGPNLVIIAVAVVVLAFFIYRWIICYFFTATWLLFIAYSLGIVGLMIGVVIAMELRSLMFQGR